MALTNKSHTREKCSISWYEFYEKTVHLKSLPRQVQKCWWKSSRGKFAFLIHFLFYKIKEKSCTKTSLLHFCSNLNPHKSLSIKSFTDFSFHKKKCSKRTEAHTRSFSQIFRLATLELEQFLHVSHQEFFRAADEKQKDMKIYELRQNFRSEKPLTLKRKS
jgi:hypothetical protein